MSDLQREEMRGEEARRVLNSDIYREAYTAVRDRIVAQLESADLPDERRNRLNDLLVAHKKAHQYMESILTTGTMAAMEIDRQATLAQRLGEKMRRVI